MSLFNPLTSQPQISGKDLEKIFSSSKNKKNMKKKKII
jgi:hypothetical protein